MPILCIMATRLDPVLFSLGFDSGCGHNVRSSWPRNQWRRTECNHQDSKSLRSRRCIAPSKLSSFNYIHFCWYFVKRSSLTSYRKRKPTFSLFLKLTFWHSYQNNCIWFSIGINFNVTSYSKEILSRLSKPRLIMKFCELIYTNKFNQYYSDFPSYI